MVMEGKKCGVYSTYPKEHKDYEGGLRTKGVFKEGTSKYPLITYITVVYNRKDTLEKCMNSVLSQDYSNIEYIVVDGASTDGTLDLIKKNADKIDYYISQPDTGIYNAMNKGIALARGELICFMNSDDICLPGTAKRVAEIYKKNDVDIICGSRALYDKGKRVYEEKYPRFSIKRSVFRYVQMFHQATYATREVFDKVGCFDEQYSLLADWIWESKAIDEKFRIYFTQEEFTGFSYDGASCKGIYQRDKEWIEWGKKTFPNMQEEDISFFIFCLDRGRHPLFDMKMTNKVAFQYYDDKKFVETYYATVLVACREQCTDIQSMGKGKEKYIIKKIMKYKLEQNFEIHNFDELIEWLEIELAVVCDRNIDVQVSKQQLERLVLIRRCLNDIFYYLYLRKEKKKHSSKLDRMLRFSCYTLSKWASRNVFLSRRFYITLRAIWSFGFKGKFVEN